MEHNHVLDKELEGCSECGLFEDYFSDVPECPGIEDTEGADEDTEDEIEEEGTLG